MELPHNLMLYVLLLVAVALGYLLGRRERSSKHSAEKPPIKDYYQGMNVLLAERSDLDVDEFLREAKVSEDTLDVHLAMAAVVRRRGELEKGIAIHQNLLASALLSTRSKQLVELELARDYSSAGILDRAEALLLKILRDNSAQASAAATLLIDIYEQERDWTNALAVGRQLVRPDRDVKQRLAHFHFELAQQALQFGQLGEARNHVRWGIDFAPDEARGYWLRSQVEMQQRRYKAVRRSLLKAYQQQPDLVSSFLPLYREACLALEDDEDFEQFLKDCLTANPDPVVLRALQQHMRASGSRLPVQELIAHVQALPQLAHVPLLMEASEQLQSGQLLAELDGAGSRDRAARELGSHLDQLTRQILNTIDESELFKCGECGFKSTSLVWQCPTCKHWGSFAKVT